VLLFIDNYDSFTFILVDYFKQLGFEILIKRNDEISIDEIVALSPKAIVIGPGPNAPRDSGLVMTIIQQFYLTKPLLGICLGHQAIGEFFNCKLVKSEYPIHGKTSQVMIHTHLLFQNLPNQFDAMRYHSLVLDEINTKEINVIATTNKNEVMAIAHHHLPIIGLQFHPESILTEHGLLILKNWKKLYYD
jgi:anthranilate synthase/aminodeoxychorismate synthase-like glutamine amidotransferase